MPKSGMMAKPMTTSQSTKGKNTEAPIDNEVAWVAASPKGNDIAVEESTRQDIAAEEPAPLVWVAKNLTTIDR
jgi:hypothetical protein